MCPGFVLPTPITGRLPSTVPSTKQRTSKTPVCLNRRSEAAKRRWQDPEYRAKMRAARAGNALVTRRVPTQTTRQRLNELLPLDCSDFVDETWGHALGYASIWKYPRDDGSELPGQEDVIEIGVCDSLTLCDEKKAAAINSYVKRNKQRSEKLTMYHNDKQRWMDAKLREGEGLRMIINNGELKRERQLLRQAEARKRHARTRARKEAEKLSTR